MDRYALLAEMNDYDRARRVDPDTPPPAGLVVAREYVDALLTVDRARVSAYASLEEQR